MFVPPEDMSRTMVVNCNLVSTTAECALVTVGIRLRLIAACSGYYTLFTTHNIILVVLITVVYVGMWIAIRKQRQRMQREGHNKMDIRKAIDVKAVDKRTVHNSLLTDAHCVDVGDYRRSLSCHTGNHVVADVVAAGKHKCKSLKEKRFRH